MIKTYYIRNDDGEKIGPYTKETLERLVSSNELSPLTLISTDGQSWTELVHLEELLGSIHDIASDFVTREERQYKRDEFIDEFVKKFVTENENFKNSFSAWKTIRLYWAKIFLPQKGYISTTVTEEGAKYTRYDFESGEATNLTQEELEKELAKTVEATDWFKILTVVVGVIWFFVFFDATKGIDYKSIILSVLCFSILLFGFFFKMKRKLYIEYKLAPDVEEKLRHIKASIEQLQKSKKVWFYKLEAIQEYRKHGWKYHAGESIRVSKFPAAFFNKKIPDVETNIRVQGIAGATSIYFLPEKIMIYNNGKVSYINYENFKLQTNFLEYVETESKIYSDTTIVDHRWKYINKDGGRDKRFKENETLPVVKCGLLEICLRLNNGQNEIFELMCSDQEAPKRFVKNWFYKWD